jgi:phosphoglycolate phosphatase-like HAD superfamily hydrolase
MVSGVGILPGTDDALRSFSTPPALATGLHPKILAKILDRFKIDKDLFYPVITSYDLEPCQAKPHPYMLEEVVRLSNANRTSLNNNGDNYTTGDVIMVGDSYNDMLMANRAGAMCIAVLTGRLSRDTAAEMQDSSINIDYIVNDIRDVPAVIKQLEFNTK